jgi:starch-binding outer membrane protein, SusD/RagB family
MKSKQLFILILIALGSLCSCKKYLDAKSDQSLTTISSLQDLQSLMDAWFVVNRLTASADEISTDDYYLTYSGYQTLPTDQMRNMYSWQPAQLFSPYTNIANDWALVYNNVYLANTVLDNMNKVTRNPQNAADWDNVRGQALFLRAYSFYKAASIWSLAWDSATSATDLGIPLRLNPDFNQVSMRASLKDTYRQILSDLHDCTTLLPPTGSHVYRASRVAGFALLSRVYLSMRQYPLAGLYADSALQINNSLMDYNSLRTAASFPVPHFNIETIYQTTVGGLGAVPIRKTLARVDSVLYQSYQPNDLRGKIFFFSNPDGTAGYKGSYDGSSQQFNGLAVDEMYLNRAEAFARAGKGDLALNDLNTLLVKRFRTGTFIPYTLPGVTDVLGTVLQERRRELIMRGTRWTDLKRFNKEGANIILQRNLNNTLYTLNPNDLRYALPIPDDIISLSGMAQNPR